MVRMNIDSTNKRYSTLKLEKKCSYHHNTIDSVLASQFLQGAAPALVRVTPCPFSLFVAVHLCTLKCPFSANVYA